MAREMSQRLQLRTVGDQVNRCLAPSVFSYQILCVLYTGVYHNVFLKKMNSKRKKKERKNHWAIFYEVNPVACSIWKKKITFSLDYCEC